MTDELHEIQEIGYSTTDMFFGAALVCEYPETLQSIDTTGDGRGQSRFVFEVPTKDASDCYRHYLAGTLQISNLRAFVLAYQYLLSEFKKSKMSGGGVYGVIRETSDGWRPGDQHSPEWWAAARQSAAKRQADRVVRESRSK